MYCGEKGFRDYKHVLEHIHEKHRDQDEHDGLMILGGGSYLDDW